ncbi:MAG: serine protease [Acidimicrobiaceae bacterium]|nr:serine protease [Acidimicrobiaceae bacterium]
MAIVALVVALLVTNLRIPGSTGVSQSDVNNTVRQGVGGALQQLQSQPPIATRVYDAARNALVVVQAQLPGKSPTDDTGAGIIIDSQGDIITALHVVQDASAIQLAFSDGTSSLGAIKSTDPAHDIAVLAAQRPPAGIAPEVLGAGPQVGDEAFALGNPLGLVASISEGVISGLNRTFPISTGHRLSGMIQFDAAVNPGSSGGPLLNTQGQVIGIVEGLANAAGTNEFSGIGFAVPIGTAGQAAGAPPK